MLVLTRRTKEQILIGDGIAVTVLSVQGKRVCIGIQAPADVSVSRPEVVQRRVKELSVVPDFTGALLSSPPMS
jgi:carbon storage regulator